MAIPHEKAILCPVCGAVDFSPIEPGMPPCGCSADGTRPCTVYPCLACIDKAIANLASQNAETRQITSLFQRK